MFNKYDRIDSKILRESVRKMECQIQTPLCDNGPCVPCHSNESRHGKGTGIKADDLFIASGCATCHAIVDGRESRMPKDEREWYLRTGILATQKKWMEHGTIVIVGDKYLKALDNLVEVVSNMDNKTPKIKAALTRIAKARP